MTYYFAQNATVEVREPGTARFKVVGAAQEVSIDTEFEVEELYQFGSILRTTAARHHASINVKVSTAQFGSFADDAAWFWKVLNAAGVSDISASNHDKKITISDTTNLPMFSIAGEWTSDDGSETIYGRVDGVYFKNFSWGGALGEYIIEELEGTGSQVTFTNNKAYAAGGAENLWADVAQRIQTNVEAVYNASNPCNVVVVDKASEYVNITATDATKKTYIDALSGDTPVKLAYEVSIDKPTGIVTINKTTPSTAGIQNVAGTVVVNIVADGIAKQIPVEFTSTIGTPVASIDVPSTAVSVSKGASNDVTINNINALTGLGVVSADDAKVKASIIGNKVHIEGIDTTTSAVNVTVSGAAMDGTALTSVSIPVTVTASFLSSKKN